MCERGSAAPRLRGSAAPRLRGSSARRLVACSCFSAAAAAAPGSPKPRQRDALSFHLLSLSRRCRPLSLLFVGCRGYAAAASAARPRLVGHEWCCTGYTAGWQRCASPSLLLFVTCDADATDTIATETNTARSIASSCARLTLRSGTAVDARQRGGRAPATKRHSSRSPSANARRMRRTAYLGPRRPRPSLASRPESRRTHTHQSQHRQLGLSVPSPQVELPAHLGGSACRTRGAAGVTRGARERARSELGGCCGEAGVSLSPSHNRKCTPAGHGAGVQPAAAGAGRGRPPCLDRAAALEEARQSALGGAQGCS